MHRKIYEAINGTIPKDEEGRSYEIHHIDGNHSNNDPSNLKCVTIQEHYDIHHSQGDWAACQLIFTRMNKTPYEISQKCSELATKNNIKRSTNGTNPFAGEQGSALSKQVQFDRVKAGTHNFVGEKGSIHSTKLNLRLLKEGRHPSQSPESMQKLSASMKKLVATGNHPAQISMRNGTHPSQQEWICPHCMRNGKGMGNAKRHHFDNCKTLRKD